MWIHQPGLEWEHRQYMLSKTVLHPCPAPILNVETAISLCLVPTFFCYICRYIPKWYIVLLVFLFYKEYYIVCEHLWFNFLLIISKMHISDVYLQFIHCHCHIYVIWRITIFTYQYSYLQIMNSFKNIKVRTIFWILCVFYCFRNGILSTIPDGIRKIFFFKDLAVWWEIQICK